MKVVEHTGRDILNELGPVSDDQFVHVDGTIALSLKVHLAHLDGLFSISLVERALIVKTEVRRLPPAQQMLEEVTASLALSRSELVFDRRAGLVERLEVDALAELSGVLLCLPNESLKQFDLCVQLFLNLLRAAHLKVAALEEEALLA